MRGLGQLRCVRSSSAIHPSRIRAEAGDLPGASTRPVHAPRAPQHLFVLGRQAPATGLQPPVIVAHVLAHLAVLLTLLLPPGRGGAVAGREERGGTSQAVVTHSPIDLASGSTPS